MGIFRKSVISENTRRYRRLRAYCLIKYSCPTDPTLKKHLVTPRDFSAGGVLFISDRPVDKNKVLEVDIYLPPLKDFFMAMAKVVRVVKIKETEQYWIGLRFTAMDPKEKEVIDSYIQRLAQDPSMKRYLDSSGRWFRRKIVR